MFYYQMEYKQVVDGIPDEVFVYGKKQSVILKDRDSNRWFLAIDIALSLGYSKYKKALKRHVEPSGIKRFGQIKRSIVTDLPPYIGDHWQFLSEEGLYQFLRSSKLKPRALELKAQYFD